MLMGLKIWDNILKKKKFVNNFLSDSQQHYTIVSTRQSIC